MGLFYCPVTDLVQAAENLSLLFLIVWRKLVPKRRAKINLVGINIPDTAMFTIVQVGPVVHDNGNWLCFSFWYKDDRSLHNWVVMIPISLIMFVLQIVYEF